MTKRTMLAAVGLAAGAYSWCNPLHAREETGIILLNDHQTSLDTTGAVRDAEVDSAGVAIARPPPLGTIAENAAPTIERRPLRRVGTLDKPVFDVELRKNFNDVEQCRFRVAAAAGIPVAKVKAGKISLHWTLLMSGQTRDTVVLETTATEFSLMKCIRRHMNGWRFTPPHGGPVSLDYDYFFPAIEASSPITTRRLKAPGSVLDLRDEECRQESEHRHHPGEVVRPFEGFRHHRVGQHGQDCASGDGCGGRDSAWNWK